MPTTDLPPDFRSERARTAANTRLAYMTAEEQQAMTAAAAAVRDANYLERLKDEIDPDRKLPEDERTKRAGYLRDALRAKRRLAAVLAEKRKQRHEAIDEEFADVSLGA